jgi:hypothetical protein
MEPPIRPRPIIAILIPTPFFSRHLLDKGKFGTVYKENIRKENLLEE